MIFLKILLDYNTISTFNFYFLGSVILHRVSTADSSDQHSFGLIRHMNISY